MITYVKGVHVHDIMSIFYQTALYFDSDTFKSAEHIYQSRKIIFHDLLEMDDLIRLVPDAKEAKKFSKQIVTKQQCEDLKPIIMGEILRINFIQCEEFRLLSTQGYIKHNVNDDFWGTGKNGKGHNVFGLLLAALRGGVKGV